MDVGSLALRTDLAVAALDGAVVHHGDHIAVSMPDQPLFYWGNYLLIAPPTSAANAARWLSRAEAARCAGAVHVALAIDATDGALDPDVAEAFTDAGATVEEVVAMTCDQPLVAATPDGLAVRRFDRAGDWQQLFELSVTIDPDTPALRAFLERRIASRAAAAARDAVRWWGAFAGDQLVASAGVVALPDCARFQDVQTHPDWRRRGAASAILAAIAADQRAAGRQRLVLVVGADNAGARAAYQRLGFVESNRAVSVLVAPKG